jgi:hypothetical protein
MPESFAISAFGFRPSDFGFRLWRPLIGNTSDRATSEQLAEGHASCEATIALGKAEVEAVEECSYAMRE